MANHPAKPEKKKEEYNDRASKDKTIVSKHLCKEGKIARSDATPFFHDHNVAAFDDPFADRRGNVQDDDSDLSAWDEETTLVELLQDSSIDEDENEKTDALAEKLRGPMNDQGQKLRQEMRDTIVPAIQQVREIHDTLENEVDMSFATGVLAFDEVCKRFETMAIRQEDELKSAYTRLQETTKKLLGQLDSAYARQERLWSDFETEIEDCATTARSILESLPEEVEQVIARLEKKNKAMEKKASNSASKEKILKGLLERL